MKFENTKLSYYDEVLEKLVSHKLGAIQIDSIRNAKFIQAVKIIIDWGDDLSNGFVLEFNNDYTLLKKRENEFFKVKQNG